MLRYIFLFCVLFPLVVRSQTNADTTRTPSKDSTMHLLPVYQFLAGSAAHAIPFWILSGTTYLKEGDRPLGGIFLGLAATAFTVPFAGNVLSGNDVSYWVGVAGVLIGQFVAGPLYNYVANHSDSITLSYIALSLPPVILSVLFYQLSL